MRRLIVLIGVGVLFFFAYITAIPLAFKMLYSALLLMGVSWLWARLGAGGLTLRRESPEGAYQAGEVFTETMVLENRAPISLPWVEVVDRSAIPQYDAGRAISLGRRRSRRWLSHGRFTARGQYQLGPADIITGDPFGIFTQVRRFEQSHTITVYPRLVDVARMLPGSAQNAGDTAAGGRYVDSPPDAFGIREHDPQDGFNRIHWPSTARLGRPMSKSFEKFEGSDVLVLLDLERRVHTGSGQRSTLEYAVSLAASVAVTGLNRAHAVGLVANDRRGTRINSGRGGQQLRAVLDYLALAQADGLTSLESTLERMAGERGTHSLVVITPSPMGKWLDRLVEIGRFGLRVSTVFHLDAASFLGEAANPTTAAGTAHTLAEQLRWWDFRAGDEIFEIAPPAVAV